MTTERSAGRAQAPGPGGGLPVCCLVAAAGRPQGALGEGASPPDRAVGEAPPFSLSGKSPWQLLFLALVIAAPLTCLGAIVALIAAKGVKYRWLWAIGCLFGFGSVSMNWTSGVVAFAPININLLAAS